MKIKEETIIELIGISWDEFHWEFDYPTVVLEPFVRYSPNGNSCERMFEDLAIEMTIKEELLESEDVSVEFEWRRWKLNRLRQVVRERFEGKDTWKTKIRECVKQKIEFYKGEDGLEFRVIKTDRA